MIKKPYHEMVTERIIEQLKQGCAPWQRPWQSGEPNSMIPTNPLTGKRYKGINAIQLMMDKYTDNRWMTYKQASSINAQVRKGEKGTAIQYWSFSETKAKLDEKGNPLHDEQGMPITIEVKLERPRVFYATVFNAEQIDGLLPSNQKEFTWNSHERAEQMLKQSNAIIHHGDSNRAYYRPTTDSIHLPNKHQFIGADNYYATALHELAHWTGHPSRLDRDLSHPFGSIGYAKEELRAEIASLMLSDELAIGHSPGNHIAYVGSWIKVLQDDPLELFRAAAEAEKIQQLVLSLEHHLVHEQQNQEAIAIPVKTIVTSPKTADENPLKYSPTDEKIWLNIPFKQKDIAKNLAGMLPDGRRAIAWDSASSRWFAHPGANLEALKPWLINTISSTKEPQINPIQEQLITEKTWLALPYAEREAVKQLAGTLPDGRKAIEWDKSQKCWFANPGSSLDKLKPWLASNTTVRQQHSLTPEQEFSDALRELGCFITDNQPIMDGTKQRIRVEGDKNSEKSGFYVGHLDGHPAGYIKNNRTGIEMKWKSKGYSLSADEKTMLEAIAEIKRQQRLDTKVASQQETARHVERQIDSLLPVYKQTPYLLLKDIRPRQGIFTNKEMSITFIPAMDETGKIWTMQSIQADGTKRFTSNGRKEGCFHPIGGIEGITSAPVLVIAEGYATAASISEALGFATISAFDAGNLKPVAEALKARFPDKPIIIMGDDDKHLEATQGINRGKVSAQEAAKAVGGYAVFPVFAPGEQARSPKSFSDFNDLASKSYLGKEAVRRQVNNIVNGLTKTSCHKKNQLKHEKVAHTVSR